MHRTLNAPKLALIAALAATLVAGPVNARSPESQADAQTPKADDLSTGTIDATPRTKEQRLKDCMAIWEPATHMSKRAWRRTCKSQLDEFPNL
jgi:hypothetical protein